MRKIFKYALDTRIDINKYSMPGIPFFLHAGPDPMGNMCIWAEVDVDKPLQECAIHVIGTGDVIPEAAQVHVCSFIHGMNAWHIYA